MSNKKRSEKDLRHLAVIRQTLAQENSPCSFCRRKICNDPCIPLRDYFRGQKRKAPVLGKPRPAAAPTVNAPTAGDSDGNFTDKIGPT